MAHDILDAPELKTPTLSCDIIIPIWNQLELTRSCLNSLLQNTPEGFHLILIDDGSEGATRDFLENFVKVVRKKVSLTLLRNDENRGYLYSVNRGLAMSKADFVIVLNNDTLLSKNWLEEMIRVAESEAQIGLVNPASNSLGTQKPLGPKFQGKFKYAGHAHGFCLLLKRKVLETLGIFDEAYGRGYYEDFDYSRRAHKAGFRVAIALGAYVQHHEHKSFSLLPPKGLAEERQKNQALYLKRHGPSLRILILLPPQNPSLSPELSEILLHLMNSGHWVFFALPWGCPLENGPRHGQAKILRFPSFLFKELVLAYMKIKKKKFDLIYCEIQNYITYLTLKYAKESKYCNSHSELLNFTTYRTKK